MCVCVCVWRGVGWGLILSDHERNILLMMFKVFLVE